MLLCECACVCVGWYECVLCVVCVCVCVCVLSVCVCVYVRVYVLCVWERGEGRERGDSLPWRIDYRKEEIKKKKNLAWNILNHDKNISCLGILQNDTELNDIPQNGIWQNNI